MGQTMDYGICIKGHKTQVPREPGGSHRRERELANRKTQGLVVEMWAQCHQALRFLLKKPEI